MAEDKNVVPMKEEKSEPDYKELYLNEKIKSLQIELQAIQLRFTEAQRELVATQQELAKYRKEKDSNNDEEKEK